MKVFASLIALLGLGLFTVGCSPEDRLDQAQEDFAEERQDTIETIGAAEADGVVTSDQQADIVNEQADDLDAAADVLDAQSDVIDDQPNN